MRMQRRRPQKPKRSNGCGSFAAHIDPEFLGRAGRVVDDVRSPVVHDRGDALPVGRRRGIDADAFQMRLHEIDHRIEMAEERALTGLDVLDRTAPFRARLAVSPRSHQMRTMKASSAILEQCHGARLVDVGAMARLCAARITDPSHRYHRNITAGAAGA